MKTLQEQTSLDSATHVFTLSASGRPSKHSSKADNTSACPLDLSLPLPSHIPCTVTDSSQDEHGGENLNLTKGYHSTLEGDEENRCLLCDKDFENLTSELNAHLKR